LHAKRKRTIGTAQKGGKATKSQKRGKLGPRRPGGKGITPGGKGKTPPDLNDFVRRGEGKEKKGGGGKGGNQPRFFCLFQKPPASKKTKAISSRQGEKVKSALEKRRKPAAGPKSNPIAKKARFPRKKGKGGGSPPSRRKGVPINQEAITKKGKGEEPNFPLKLVQEKKTREGETEKTGGSNGSVGGANRFKHLVRKRGGTVNSSSKKL